MCLLHRYGGRSAAMYEFDGRIYIVVCKNVEALTRKTTDCVKISAGSTRLGININTLGLRAEPMPRNHSIVLTSKSFPETLFVSEERRGASSPRLIHYERILSTMLESCCFKLHCGTTLSNLGVFLLLWSRKVFVKATTKGTIE